MTNVRSQKGRFGGPPLWSWVGGWGRRTYPPVLSEEEVLAGFGGEEGGRGAVAKPLVKSKVDLGNIVAGLVETDAHADADRKLAPPILATLALLIAPTPLELEAIIELPYPSIQSTSENKRSSKSWTREKPK